MRYSKRDFVVWVLDFSIVCCWPIFREQYQHLHRNLGSLYNHIQGGSGRTALDTLTSNHGQQIEWRREDGSLHTSLLRWSSKPERGLRREAHKHSFVSFLRMVLVFFGMSHTLLYEHIRGWKL